MKFKYIASLVLEILKLWLKFHDSPKFSKIRKFFARLELSNLKQKILILTVLV